SWFVTSARPLSEAILDYSPWGCGAGDGGVNGVGGSGGIRPSATSFSVILRLISISTICSSGDIALGWGCGLAAVGAVKPCDGATKPCEGETRPDCVVTGCAG